MSSFYDFKQLSHDTAPLVQEDDHDHLHDPFTTLPTHGHFPMFYDFTPQVQATNNFNTDHYQEINIDHAMFHSETEDDRQKSNQWKSSKMRITRKMMDPKPKKSIKQATSIPDRKRRLKHDSSSLSIATNTTNDDIVRVCSDCKTTKTPLWRSGPSGPKTLCNACGIRQRKARRAMAAAAAVSVGLIPPSVKTTPSNNKTNHKKAVDASDRMIPFKKRCRFSTANNATTSLAQKKKLCLDDIVIRLSKSSAFHRVFPQDEKDAAILLMAISCGLMCS